MNSFPNFIQVSFSTYCQTHFGQTVCIVGNCPELGNWDPNFSLKLQTTPKEYPIWYSKRPISIEKLSCIEFKICIIEKSTQSVRWENLKNNRAICLKKSSSIFISYDQKQAQIDDEDTETEGSEQEWSGKKSTLTEIKQEEDQDQVNVQEIEFDKQDNCTNLSTSTTLKSIGIAKQNTSELQYFCRSLNGSNSGKQTDEKDIQLLNSNQLMRSQENILS